MRLVETPFENGRKLYEVVTDEGVHASQTGLSVFDSRFGRGYVECACICGVGTEPQFRRSGCVRTAFEAFFRDAREHPEWAVSFLHPFSFPYYRRMGYEKISYHKSMEMPIDKLDMFPRFSGFEPFAPEMEGELLSCYRRFAMGRSMMFDRKDMAMFPLRGKNKLYVLKENGQIHAYIVWRVEDRMVVNRMIGDRLVVDEYGFDSPEALYKLFGFIRMFDGQVLNVFFTDTAMAPEIDMNLRHYHSVEYRLYPDISAKILNLKTMLEMNEYPRSGGSFTLAEAGGTAWRVEYEDGCVRVKEAHGGADVTCDSPSLSRIIYGAEPMTSERLKYMPGVRIDGDPEDLLRAFPVRAGGVFEHF